MHRIELPTHKNIISTLLKFTHKQNQKYNHTLDGILVEIDPTKDMVTLVASDTFRLMAVEIKMGCPEADNNHLTKNILKPIAIQMRQEYIDKKYYLYIGDFSPIETIEGSFPQWRNLIPQENEYPEIARIENIDGDIFYTSRHPKLRLQNKYITDLGSIVTANKPMIFNSNMPSNMLYAKMSWGHVMLMPAR
jgi:hypothetical protein